MVHLSAFGKKIKLTAISIKKQKTDFSLPPLFPGAVYLPVLRLVAVLGNDNKLRKTVRIVNCIYWRRTIWGLRKTNVDFWKTNVRVCFGSNDDRNI